jgi:hypothetical protein
MSDEVKEKKINADDRSIYLLLSKQKFFIDFFQREYR